VRGLAGLAGKRVEMRLRLIAQLQSSDGPRSEFEEPETERVPAGFGVAPDQPVLVEHREEAVDGALVEGQALGDFAGRELAGIFRQDLQDVDRALEHLHPVNGPFR